MKNTLKKMGWVLLIGLLFYACQKDHNLSESSVHSPEIEKLASWYQSKLKVSEDNPFSELQPDWGRTYSQEHQGQTVYEVELKNPEKLLSMSNLRKQDSPEREVKKHTIKLLVFENRKTGKILYGAYMSAESGSSISGSKIRYKDVGNFTGSVLYYHFNGRLSNGWIYEQGKLSRSISPITKQQYVQQLSSSDKGTKGKLASANNEVCNFALADVYKWGCVGVSGYENCGYHYSGSSYVQICKTVDQPEEPIDHIIGGDGSGGEYVPPIYIDCADIENGNAYWNAGCKTCMGGTTGITECPEKDIKHKLDSFPCAKALILSMSTLNTDISNLIKNTFGRNDRINLTVEPNASLAGTTTDGQLGTHFTFTTGGKLYYDINIGINPDILRNATKEYILVTIYHEALHAYLTFKRDELGETEFNRQFAGISVHGGRLIGVQDPQHWTMGYTNFVNGLRDVILAYNPGFDTTRAYALALGGINNLTPAQQTINQQEKNTSVAGYTGTKCP